MEARMKLGGSLAIQKIRRQGPGNLWRVMNWRHVWAGWWRWMVSRLLGIPTFYATLEVRVVKASGEIVHYGVVCTRCVTDAFVAALATYMYDGSGVAPTAFDYHASGTGTNAEAAGNTTLQTDSGVARASGTASNLSAGLYRSVGTQSYSGGLAITEHGLFSASSGGTLLDRSVFSAINVVNGDSIQFTYTLTISSGG
jgi:hypothetical protein